MALFLLYMAYRVKQLLSSGMDTTQIRHLFLGREENASFFTNKLLKILHARVFQPCLYAILPALMLCVFEKKYLPECIAGFLLLLVYQLLIGGRFILLYIIVDIFLILGFREHQPLRIIIDYVRGAEKKRKKIIFSSVILSVVLFSAIVVAIFLAVPYLRAKTKSSFRKGGN